MKFTSIFLFLFLFYSSLGYSQITIGKTILPAHDSLHQDHGQDHSYHCSGCKSHLFEADEASLVDKNELHYHGIATDSTKIAFHCAGCKSHIGYYVHADSSYQVPNNKIDKKESSKFHCLSCQMPLFDKESLSNSDETSSYFSTPIDKQRILLDERKKFYKIQNADAVCGRCNTRLGAVKKNDSGGFGMRLNLGVPK